MYYWILYDIALMRIMTYNTYSSYCDRLIRKIINPILKNYQDSGTLARIQTSDEAHTDPASRKLFKDVN